MTREEQIKQASNAYTRVNCPMAMGGDRFKNMIDSINANPAFIAGAEWADKNVNYKSEVVITLPNGCVEICTIEKLIEMFNAQYMELESKTLVGNARKLDKALKEWKESINNKSLIGLATKFIKRK